MLYACDLSWWRHYYRRVATEFAGELWTVSDSARDEFGLYWIMGRDAAGLGRAPDHIHTGKNSGYQAINLAYLFGARRIVLLGFDMAVDGPRRHWHGDHPKGLGNGGSNRYGAWLRALELLVADLKGTRCEILNASRRTAIRCIPRVALEIALE